MGVEILQVPQWDFSNPLMGGWRFSNWSFGDSPSLLWGDGDSPSGKLWILHGHGDSPNSRMGFPHDYYVAMESLQLVIWGFSECQNGIPPILLYGNGQSPTGHLGILYGYGDSLTDRMGFLHQGNDVTFVVHVRPLWDWALDLLQNPSLAPHFVWDAQQVFRHNGEQYERFYTEPWTGDRWWDIQSRLPTRAENATPFAFILYADKTRLSSHGTVKGYPVIVRCTNLPVHIRNGDRYGGGCVVGWLPIVPELAKEESKTGYVNFKHVIWHEAFLKLLEKVAELSKVGYLHECYDGVLRWLFPLILILSADYEELCVMTLIRRTKCKRPCPICLVPLEKLWDLSKTYEMRTVKQHKEALVAYEIKKSVGEKKLKSLGLRPIKNVFWLVEHSEPEQAASFEPLHYMHGGMGGKHMHEELKIIVGGLSREFETWLEEQVSVFPRWRGLAHFDTVIHVTFSDGNKMRDLTR
ncbi:hypothetical protein EDD15DRAFT_2377451 [Pisolithus albus]|nr:hypothetical protein EDD15DRAFT_2377451 [Pisolithus albus]